MQTKGLLASHVKVHPLRQLALSIIHSGTSLASLDNARDTTQHTKASTMMLADDGYVANVFFYSGVLCSYLLR